MQILQQMFQKLCDPGTRRAHTAGSDDDMERSGKNGQIGCSKV
jgi:hypothetical protein